MTRHFVCVRQSDGQVVLNASWLLSCIILSNGKLTRLPQIYLDRYLVG